MNGLVSTGPTPSSSEAVMTTGKSCQGALSCLSCLEAIGLHLWLCNSSEEPECIWNKIFSPRFVPLSGVISAWRLHCSFTLWYKNIAYLTAVEPNIKIQLFSTVISEVTAQNINGGVKKHVFLSTFCNLRAFKGSFVILKAYLVVFSLFLTKTEEQNLKYL